jgi:hypothetical protein
MPEAASYAAIEVLRDGTRVDIRALRPDDRAAILAAVDHTSERSLYRRFLPRDAASASGKLRSFSMSTSSATWHWSRW